MRKKFRSIWDKWGWSIAALTCCGLFAFYMYGPERACSTVFECGALLIGISGWLVLLVVFFVTKGRHIDLGTGLNLFLTALMTIATIASSYTSWNLMQQSHIESFIRAYPLVRFSLDQDDFSVNIQNFGNAPALILGLDLYSNGKRLTFSRKAETDEHRELANRFFGEIMSDIYNLNELGEAVRENFPGIDASFGARAYDIGVGYIVPPGKDGRIKIFGMQMLTRSKVSMEELRETTWATKFGTTSGTTVSVCYCSLTSAERQCYVSDLTARSTETVDSCIPNRYDGRTIIE